MIDVEQRALGALEQQAVTARHRLGEFAGHVGDHRRDAFAQRDEIALVSADLDANDAGAVSILPAGCVLVGITYDSDDLDTNGTPTITASVGVMNAADSDLATVLASGITASRDRANVIA